MTATKTASTAAALATVGDQRVNVKLSTTGMASAMNASLPPRAVAVTRRNLVAFAKGRPFGIAAFTFTDDRIAAIDFFLEPGLLSRLG